MAWVQVLVSELRSPKPHGTKGQGEIGSPICQKRKKKKECWLGFKPRHLAPESVPLTEGGALDICPAPMTQWGMGNLAVSQILLFVAQAGRL